MQDTAPCTTRPQRDYEVDGVHYHFLTDDTVKTLRSEGLLAEYSEFNGWKYCLTDEELKNSNLVVVEPHGLKQIIDNFGRENIFVVYLIYPDKDRLIRSLVARNDNDVDEVIRRFQADRRDMEGMEWLADVTIVNHNSEETANLIYKMVGM